MVIAHVCCICTAMLVPPGAPVKNKSPSVLRHGGCYQRCHRLSKDSWLTLISLSVLPDGRDQTGCISQMILRLIMESPKIKMSASNKWKVNLTGYLDPTMFSPLNSNKQTEKDDGLKMERGYRTFTVNNCGGRGRIKAMTVVLCEGNGARLVGW